MWLLGATFSPVMGCLLKGGRMLYLLRPDAVHLNSKPPRRRFSSTTDLLLVLNDCCQGTNLTRTTAGGHVARELLWSYLKNSLQYTR